MTYSLAQEQRPRPDWWVLLAMAMALLQGALFLIPQTHFGLLGVVCWLLGCSRPLWLGMASILLLCGILWSAWHLPFWNRWRLAGYLAVLVLAPSPLAFQAYPSSHDHRPSQLQFRLPLDGPVTVTWGGASPNLNYHVFAPDQHWAMTSWSPRTASRSAGMAAALVIITATVCLRSLRQRGLSTPSLMATRTCRSASWVAAKTHAVTKSCWKWRRTSSCSTVTRSQAQFLSRRGPCNDGSGAGSGRQFRE
jgi:hypothetical protein